jgi:hypothetical protein
VTWPRVRNILLFAGGFAGMASEAVRSWVQGNSFLEHPTLLLVYAAMMGVTAFLQADERAQKENRDGDDQ